MSANRYAKGQIYTIRSHQTDDVYIGSTCSPLHKRLSEHRGNFKQWKEGKDVRYVTSFEIVKYDDAYVELLEDFPCDNKKELNRREGQLIRQNACVNKNVPGRTRAEYRAEYSEEDKVRVSEYHREYRQLHKDAILAREKEYAEANKAKISQRQAEKVTCECGAVVCRSYISTHKKSEKHALLLAEKSQAIL